MKTAGLLISLIPFYLFGQNLTGTWTGTGGTGASYLKLVIVQMGDSCFGYSYDEGPGFCKANFAGRFDSESQKLKGKGTGFISKSFGHSLAVFNLDYSKDSQGEYLDGTLGPKGAGAFLLSLGIASHAQLRKVDKLVDTTRFISEKIIDYKNKPGKSDSLKLVAPGQRAFVAAEKDFSNIKKENPDLPLKEKEDRAPGMVKIIYTDADTVKMELYDNGVVDDDTVTVFFDNTIILDHYRISEKAKELYLPLVKNGQTHTVELFADNLGTIPPNTALIIIMAGKERYQVYASYDLSTNAKIIFQLKE